MNRKGITLDEIRIVVAIIALLAAIAIPNLLRARLNSNESAAISALKTIATGAISFRSVNVAYPANLAALSGATPAYIDGALGAALPGTNGRGGYVFTLAGTASAFTATAQPVIFQTTGVRSFFVDESGVIRWTDANAAATVASTVLE